MWSATWRGLAVVDVSDPDSRYRMQTMKAKTVLLGWTVLCNLSSNISQALHCPSDCVCDTSVIDCSNRHLALVPHMQPKSTASVVNFSSNSLTSLEDLHNFPVSQASLDLSFNQISFVPLNAFSGKQFLELLTLNLTSNLISDVRFVFPSSLQILKLSRNKIHHFCVDRLKTLLQLRVLYLDSNGLKTLFCEEGEKEKKNSFQGTCPFQPLQRISEVWLHGNKLKVIDQTALQCFQNTRFLSLADNALRFLPEKVFQAFQKLKYLDLSGNDLTFVPEAMFVHLSSLKFLSLARNQLAHVPAVLPMLEWLDLSNNAITNIPEKQKSDLYPQEVFLIGGNPFHCTCDMLWLKELFDTREYLLKYIEVEWNNFIPICASPDHIRGDSWDVLGDQAFGCRDGGESQKESLQEHKEKITTLRLDDLSFKVRDVGTTHVRLDWDSLSLGRQKVSEGSEPRKVFISCHPFGRKQERKSAIVQLSLGTHRLRGLQPSTAYIVCISLPDPLSSESHSPGRNDCVEVVTKEDERSRLTDIYMRIGIVLLVSVLLAIKCCYTSNLRKDVSARRHGEKEE